MTWPHRCEMERGGAHWDIVSLPAKAAAERPSSASARRMAGTTTTGYGEFRSRRRALLSGRLAKRPVHAIAQKRPVGALNGKSGLHVPLDKSRL